MATAIAQKSKAERPADRQADAVAEAPGGAALDRCFGGLGRLLARRRSGGGRGDRGAHQAVAPYLLIARRVAQPTSESIAAEKSSTVAIANSVAFAGGELS